MHIIWFIIGYFLIGAILAYLYAKLGRDEADGGRCILMIWAWPFVLLVGLVAIWPGEWFDKVCRQAREERHIKEREKRWKMLEENCSKCAWHNTLCTSADKPWTSYCYVRPRKEKKDEPQKTE